MLREFAFATFFSLICLVIAFIWGGPSGLLIAIILGAMELSLSFDNAVVNAAVLRNMSAVWQRRFLTWGILIAVFGMRVIFPVVIVALVAGLGIFEVVNMAFTNPNEYAHHLEQAHIPIAAFGGMFLTMVVLHYLMNPGKDEHWIGFIERRLARAGQLESVQILIAGGLLLLLTQFLVPTGEKFIALLSGLIGILLYTLIHSLSTFFNSKTVENIASNGIIAFLYLEILDASFSLDGVIGAFAITRDIVIIAVGLAIGAVFVRSLTIFLVKKGTLKQYVYLEHGAHYGIAALAVIMLISMRFPIPEIITGLIGVAFILLSLWSSIRQNNNISNDSA